jgi:YhcH/YjgK/YiaL family protein
MMMVLDDTGNFPKESFEKALLFLKTADLSVLQPRDVIQIDDDMVFAQVQEYETQPEENIAFENHIAYYDLHYVVNGKEYIYSANAKGLRQKNAYNPKDDIAFYEEPPHYERFLLNAGEAVLIAPGEAHRSRCSVDKPGIVKKIVVKIKN